MSFNNEYYVNSENEGEENNNQSYGTKTNSEAGNSENMGSPVSAVNSEAEAENSENTGSPVSAVNSEAEPESSPLEEGTGAEVLASAPADEEAESMFFLGDFVRIETPERTIEGILYYVSEDLIRIMPTGATDRLVDIVPADLETMDITRFVLNPGPRTTFANLYSLRAGLKLLAIKGEGETLGEYKILTVNRENDSILIEDETGGTFDVQFAGRGIPLELEFDILRVVSYETDEEMTGVRVNLIAEEANSANESNTRSAEEEYEPAKKYTTMVEVTKFKGEAPPKIVKYTEIKKSEMIYPEAVQKNDFLSNLLEMFEPAQRTNPLIVRRIRALVEMASNLKKAVVEKAADGTVIGEKRVYVRTLEDLFKANSVPLSIPIVNADRQVFVDKIKLEEEQSAEDREDENATPAAPVEQINFVEGVSIHQFAEAFGQMARDMSEGAFNELAKNDNPDYPRWYEYLNRFIHNNSPGFIYNSAIEPPHEFMHDKEFFRGIPGEDLGGLRKGSAYTGKSLLTDKYITEDIKFSVGRALGPTYRVNSRGEEVKAIPGAETDVYGYVLFPPGSAAYMGARRTGKLFYDVARSRGEQMTMESIIKDMGGVMRVGEDDATTDIQKVLYFDKMTSRLGQFSFDDFLEITLKTLTPLGPGDLNAHRADYGIEEYEFTQEQMDLVDERIRAVIAAVRSRIGELRSTPASIPGTSNPLLPEAGFYGRLKEMTSAHPYLAEHITTFETIMPHYRENDIALLAYLLTVAQDYTMAVLGGVETVVEREKLRHRLVKRMKEREQVYRERALAEKRIAPPAENPCPHVKELASVRLVKDDDSRMALLVQFMNIYQGKRVDNWYSCNICDQHLLCHHEYLQMQQFLHPREKSVLEKQLRLAYTKKGAYNGAYICTNCGIPVRALEFDTHLEMDDNGNPLMGRSEIDAGLMVDEDEELKKQLGLKDEEGHKELDLKDPAKKEIYDVMRQIIGKLGIRFDSKSERNVMNRAYGLLQNQQYVKTQIKTKEQYNAELAAYKKKNPKASLLSYEGYYATKVIQYVASLVILEMQCNIPNYYPLYTEPGCTAGFDGYPLDPVEGEPTSENVGLFVHYMVCCLMSLLREHYPWNLTSWAALRKTDDKKNLLTTDVIKGLKIVLKESYASRMLEKKRAYVEKTFGRRTIGERPSESIPDHFMPVMMFSDEQKMAAAENPQQAAVVARNNANRRTYNSSAAYVQSIGWINSAHAQARATVLKDGGPRAETGSCFGTYEIPGAYIQAHAEEYPALPPRLSPSLVYKTRSIFGVPYISQPILDVDIHLDTKYSWEVYMRICYKGDRKGMPHELALHALPTDPAKPQDFAHKCDWCGMIVPTEYAYPDIDAKGAPVMTEEVVAKIKQSLVNQTIADTEENFLELIDTIHKTMIFNPYSVARVRRDVVFQQLPALAPPPFEPMVALDVEAGTSTEPVTWPGILDSVRSAVEANSAHTEFDILQQIAPFDAQAGNLRNAVFDLYAGRIYAGINRERLFQVFDTKLLVGPTTKVLERIRAYYLLPLQRIVNDDYAGVTTIMAHKKEHKSFKEVDDKLLKALEDKKAWKKFMPLEQLTDETCKPILEKYLDRVGAYIRLGLELNESRLPYRDTLAKILMKILFYGPLYEMLKAAPAKYRIPLMNLIISLSNVFTIENRDYELSEIREVKAQLKEREQQSFIDIFDRLSDEQKRLELMCKNLGIKSSISGKDWSVGGTKKVYQYDPDFWNVQQGEFGRNETDYGDAGGYDVRQYGDDD